MFVMKKVLGSALGLVSSAVFGASMPEETVSRTATQSEIAQVAGALDEGFRPFYRVEALQSNLHLVSGLAGVPLTILLEGDGYTNLDCRVYDENDRLVAQDLNATDVCVIVFTPRWTGPFVLEVENRGLVFNVYELVAF
jgi:hypothetical protein